ncbi:hypothetical protein [Paenibacillus periandrae]|uniref:hypothetical protein n=1 Tax=Paenibacillus periandrae TaxID=1761741 RepID=UPI001F09D741|nr:hypothetical protein [Paenibacillus periandrae]
MNSISHNVNNAISKLFQEDIYLLVNDLNERTIAHKLATYLQEEFPYLNVDCEYNKNIDEEKSSKNIYQVKAEAEKLGKTVKKEILINDIEYAKFSIYPDIVVHRRGGSESNFLIIEIKKSTNPTDRVFDYTKLECYTDKSDHNKLHYTFGLFIEFETGVLLPEKHELIWFKEGKQLKDF